MGGAGLDGEGEGAGEEPGRGGAAPPRYGIRVGREGRLHVERRHFPGGAESSGKSTFYSDENLDGLLKQAESVRPELQKNGYYRRVVNAGWPIAIDRETGKPTSFYTVITKRGGWLVTAYPGR
jgi:hypothetical protein